MRRSTRLIHERTRARAAMIQSTVSKQVDLAFDKLTARRLGDLLILHDDGKTRYTFTEIKTLVGDLRAATLSADLQKLVDAGFIRIKAPATKAKYVGKRNIYYLRRKRVEQVFSSISESLNGDSGSGEDSVGDTKMSQEEEVK